MISLLVSYKTLYNLSPSPMNTKKLKEMLKVKEHLNIKYYKCYITRSFCKRLIKNDYEFIFWNTTKKEIKEEFFSIDENWELFFIKNWWIFNFQFIYWRYIFDRHNIINKITKLTERSILSQEKYLKCSDL